MAKILQKVRRTIIIDGEVRIAEPSNIATASKKIWTPGDPEGIICKAKYKDIIARM